MMRLLQNWILIGLAAILLVACGGDSQGDLDDASQLALEIGIVSTLAGQNAIFNPTPISDSLRNRIEKLGNIQMRNSTYGMMFSDHLISENGGLLMTVEISSPFSASIEVRGGEIGLRDGDTYIVEGTKLTNADGKTFTFIRGKWSGKTQKPLTPGADTVTIMTISMSPKTEAWGISNEESTRAFIKASSLFDAYGQSTEKNDKSLSALIEAIEKIEVKAHGNDFIYFADIALIEAYEARKSSENDKNRLSLAVSE